MQSWKTAVLVGLVTVGISGGMVFAQPSGDPSAFRSNPSVSAQMMPPGPSPVTTPQYGHHPRAPRGSGYYDNQERSGLSTPGYIVDYRHNGYGYHHQGRRRGGHCWW